TLPCLHSFCEHCLEGLPLDKKNKPYYLSCPTCRHCTELPEEGAGAFPVAFHINSLKEIYSLMKKVADPEQVTCDNCITANSTGYCKDCSKFLCTKCDGIHKQWGPTSNHQLTSLDEMTASDVFSTSQLLAPAKQEATLTCSVPGHDEPLKYYCDTCDESICRDCIIVTHKDHKYNLIANSFTKHKEALEKSLNPVKEKIEGLKKVLSALVEREGGIRERGEGVLEEIHEMVEEMVNVLRESERKLTEQAKRVTDAKLKVLSEQMKSAEMSLSLLENVEDYVEQSLKTGSPQQVLRCKKQMMERMSEVTGGMNVEELHPKEKADFVLSKDIKSLHHIGDIVLLQQYRVKKIDHVTCAGKAVSFSLSMEAPDSSVLSVPISSLKCSLVPVGKGDEPIDTTVTTTSTDPGVYRIQCNPSTSGTHTVKVQVYDVDLEDTSLVIPFNPYLDNITPVRTITQLDCPWAVAVSDDNHVIITEFSGHCVTILDREGKKVKSLGGEGGSGNEFIFPSGVAITPDKFILVSGSSSIQKISMDGYLVATVSEKGIGPLQFSTPDGIAISPITGQVYIADSGYHRIQVLNPDLTFSHSFGSKGSTNGRFQSPRDIAIDSQGLVYVADQCNHRIQKFSPDGKFVGQFGTEGSGPGQLDWPNGITIDTAATGLVYVSENGNHRISVFTSDELPEEGAGAFPVAFTLNNLKEIYSLMKKVADPQQVTCDNCTTANATGYCKDCTPAKQEATLTCSVPGHEDSLRYYCDTCDESICRDCIMLAHKDHKYNLIANSFTKHKEALEKSLNPVKGKIEGLKKVLSALAEREGEIRERGEGVLEEIHEMVEEMMNVLRESERKLTEQAKRVTDDKLKVLSEQMKSAEISLSVLEDVEDYVEQSLKTGSPQQVLRCKKQMMECMSEVTAGINVEELHPKEKANFVLSKDIKSPHHIGDIVTYSSTALQQCRVKKVGYFEHIPKEKKVSFSLSMEAPDSSVLCVPLSSLKCSVVLVGKGDEPIDTTVTTTSTDPGVYRIQCNPSTSGTHTVKVQVSDVHLEDTSLVIPINPYLDNITPVCTITKLIWPWGVAVTDDNHLIVTESGGNCITILDRKGKKVKSLEGEGGSGNVKFSPRGVAITPDKFILVSDSNRIQKISMYGYLMASVGEYGSGPLQFKYPRGIAISPITGQVYIADYSNHRIQVLNPDLTFSHSFGSEGSANGQFKSPYGIAIDSQGLVYVADSDNCCIQKFSPDGKFVGKFGTYGSGPGQLYMPTGIAIDTAATGLVYVGEEGNGRISVFTSDGVFVRKFGSKGSNIDQFKSLYGLAFDKDGFLY
uniref:B box-type domain-containing protein n=1 Tax=Amphimedon queenslandica TaxID=400682 RepID=A0A1X7UI38_AMPQE